MMTWGCKMPKICQYCGSEKRADKVRCTGCDAADFGDRPAQRMRDCSPFYYNGYVVWWIEDIGYRTFEFLFYLGNQLVERITLHRDVLRRFVSEHYDTMPFVWDLFKLAQGEEEVLRITEQNAVKPVVFEITVKPSPEHGWAIGLTRGDIYEAIEKGKRELTYRAQ